MEEKLHFSALRANAKFLRRMQYFCKRTQMFLERTLVSRGNAIQMFCKWMQNFCERTNFHSQNIILLQENAKTLNTCFSSHHHVSLRALLKLTKKLQQKKTFHNKQDMRCSYFLKAVQSKSVCTSEWKRKANAASTKIKYNINNITINLHV